MSVIEKNLVHLRRVKNATNISFRHIEIFIEPAAGREKADLKLHHV